MLRLAIAKIKAPPEKLFGELLIVPKDELTYLNMFHFKTLYSRQEDYGQNKKRDKTQ